MSHSITIRGGYALFWGQWPSNWQPSPFVLDGQTYNCVEQWMMAEKARLFGDTAVEAKVMATLDPAEQKALGRTFGGMTTPSGQRFVTSKSFVG